MKKKRQLVSFDWAIKRLLRNKANFEVVEGFLSELLGRDIKIISVLESESNQSDLQDKYNRVDVVVEDELNEIILIEIQFAPDVEYFQRMLYGTSKAITERMSSGHEYGQIRKIYSVNIVYFALGQGKDYVYHGRTDFKGLHENDILELSLEQRDKFGKVEPGDIYPEYYILKINHFNDVAKSTLDEWIYFLKNDRIEDGFTAKGLLKAREELNYYRLSPEEKEEFDRIKGEKEETRRAFEFIHLTEKVKFKKEIEESKKALEESKKEIEKRDKAIEERDRAIEESRKKNEEQEREIAELKRRLNK
ncbi:MAG: Rpn family recombination-promoting nuclease/putative transposase [Prevotellaceae bacterium]|jgi:predicted transposase/invertase (TIGR01784 family)|nr:Rpn family recombination-promoting nuclease/putative transposase [Prevotellaceae bacterium]